MDFILQGFREAWRLIVSGDAGVLHAVQVTLLCSLTAVTLAAIVALPLGAWLGIRRPRGDGLLVFLARVGMFTPTVVIGLFVFTLLSRRGPLGSIDALYTRGAIIAGEFLLALPLLVVLVHGATASLSPRVAETARTLGAGRLRILLTVLGEVRVGLTAAYLVALARCLSELGIALNVGGNFEGRTRTLATTITTELSMGAFARAIACGVLLMILAVGFAFAAHLLGGERRR